MRVAFIPYLQVMPSLAKLIVASVAVLWLLLMAVLLEDPLGIVGGIFVTAGLVTLVVLVVVVDAAVRAARQLK